MIIRSEKWKRNNAKWWNVFMRCLKGMQKRCRTFVFACMAIAYVTAYFSISSNSTYLPLGEVSHVDRHHESVYDSHLSEIQETARGIARVYEPSHPSTWCVDSLLKYDQIPRQPMGLCYLRIPHAAGATLKGINMRISRNFGQRHGMENCIRHDSNSKGVDYQLRDKKSYLWTFVRHPTHRAMSTIGSTLSNRLIKSSKRGFFHESNHTVLVNNTLLMLRNHEGRGGFQLEYLMQKYIPVNQVNNPLLPTTVENRNRLTKRIYETFGGYDFVGVVERFDESLLAMQLLLGLESSDILYFAVNRKEQWRKARSRKKFVCRDSFNWEVDLVTQPLVRDYLEESEDWYANNYGDYLLYHTASQSLDRTILKIGLEYFSQELKKFRALLKRAHEECSPKFPCSLNGTAQMEEAERDCLDNDNTGIGCGYRCLDGLTT